MTQPLTSVSETLLAGRYRLGRQIGYGGMGRVYEAQDERLDRPVAVKLIAAAPGVDDELEREARAAARLTHPGIVRVFDAGMWPGGGFIVMELVSGGSLKHLLLERRTLPMAEALPLVAELADALEHAHRQGVVHCDVKPNNILITSEGQPKLVDFGIARAVTISGTRTRATVWPLSSRSAWRAIRPRPASSTPLFRRRWMRRCCGLWREIPMSAFRLPLSSATLCGGWRTACPLGPPRPFGSCVGPRRATVRAFAKRTAQPRPERLGSAQAGRGVCGHSTCGSCRSRRVWSCCWWCWRSLWGPGGAPRRRWRFLMSPASA